MIGFERSRYPLRNPKTSSGFPAYKFPPFPVEPLRQNVRRQTTSATIVMNLIWVCLQPDHPRGPPPRSHGRAASRRPGPSALAHDRACRCATRQRIPHPRRHHRCLERRPHDPHGARLYRKTPATPIKLTLPVLDGNATLPATLVGVSGNTLRAQFDPLTLQEERGPHHGALLPAPTPGSAGRNPRTRQGPWTSLGRRIIKLAFFGLTPRHFAIVIQVEGSFAAAQTHHQQSRPSSFFLAVPPRPRHRAPVQRSRKPPSAQNAAPVPLRQHPRSLRPRACPTTSSCMVADAYDTVHFSLQRTQQLVKTATMRLPLQTYRRHSSHLSAM